MATYSKEVQNIFKENFGEERLPDRHCVVALMKKFEQAGSVQDRPRSGRPSVINNEALRDVTKKLDRSPHKSLRPSFTGSWYVVNVNLQSS